MRLKEFSIIRYGPLSGIGKISLNDFNLFWGNNEAGKTLTIDALVKLLLKGNSGDFERIERVEENPEGYVIVEDHSGEEIKLPEKGDLTEVAGLTSTECRNIFIVRNSNLSIARDIAEGEFYTNVTDRLTGLRTDEISEIKENLREIGKITPTGKFSNTQETHKLKGRLQEARSLVKEIENLMEKLKEEDFDELEEKFVEQEETLEEIEEKIGRFEEARKREEYEKAKKALSSLKNSLQKYEGLKDYNEDDRQLWRDCKSKINTWKDKKEKLATERQENQKKLDELEKELGSVESDFKAFEDRKKKIDDDVKPAIRNYKEKSKKLAQRETQNKFFTSVAVVSAILLGISLLGVLIRPSILFTVSTIFFLLSAVISGIFKYQYLRDKSRSMELLREIKLDLSQWEMDAENIGEILSNIRDFEEAYVSKKDELQRLKRRWESLKEKITELRDKKIPNVKDKIENAKGEIKKIKRKSSEETLEAYSETLATKQKLENSIGQQKRVLESHLGKESEELEENISYWEEQVEELREYRNKAEGIQYSRSAVSKLEDEREEVEDNLEELEDRMEDFQEEMEGVQRRANEILISEDEPIYCKTSVDLQAVKSKLEDFIKEHETIREIVLEARDIFEEIESEEKEKVSELFGKESPVSRYFSEITNRRYEAVIFNKDKGRSGEVEVKRKDGKILEAGKLSGGTYDQLYLSIRLALGEKLLKSKKGFFILDDPFIKADPERLQKQIETIQRISELGWQVIYFSAKGEIKEILKENIEGDDINYIPMDPLS